MALQGQNYWEDITVVISKLPQTVLPFLYGHHISQRRALCSLKWCFVLFFNVLCLICCVLSNILFFFFFFFLGPLGPFCIDTSI